MPRDNQKTLLIQIITQDASSADHQTAKKAPSKLSWASLSWPGADQPGHPGGVGGPTQAELTQGAHRHLAALHCPSLAGDG